MPGMDGTGPLGLGPKTGRALGRCTGGATGFFRYGCGLGCGYGRGRGFRRFTAMDSKEALNARKRLLQDELSAIEEQLLDR